MKQLDWKKLLNSTRRKDLDSDATAILANVGGTRTEIERDYDRILFSTPVRRLADKTQVFPLEKNDSVRNRLTHSHEVSNLARSVGVALVYGENALPKEDQEKRDIPSMLAAIGLAHDIGNPPFGHQGEKAIGSWFKDNPNTLDFQLCETNIIDAVTITRMKGDFLRFEGNAQAFRILTKLQILNDQYGLNLTVGTLAALMKYPTTSDKTDENKVPLKKFGCFHSEIDCCYEVWEQTELKGGVRHPLAYIMEACDDIAYSVLDVEDAIKKALVSYRDLINYLQNLNSDKPSDKEALLLLERVIEQSEKKHKVHKQEDLSPAEINDISMQMFRVYAIHAMITSITETFTSEYGDIMSGAFEGDLIGGSKAKVLCKGLKKFAFKNAYQTQNVLELELEGYRIIRSLMDMMWPAIEMRGNPITQKKHQGNPFERYVYGRISENYRRVFEDKNNTLPLNYKRCQLLADMVSGMTDSFAIDFETELAKLRIPPT